MDKQVKNLALLHRRIKTVISSCSKMSPNEYRRARDYIKSRHKVDLPFEKPEQPQPIIIPQHN